MIDYRIEDGVTMGRLTSPPHTDNVLRVYASSNGKVVIQLRCESWYLCRDLNETRVVELINALSGALMEARQAVSASAPSAVK